MLLRIFVRKITKTNKNTKNNENLKPKRVIIQKLSLFLAPQLR